MCAGTYTESVLINRSVSVVAQTPAAPAVECLSTSIDQDARMAVLIGGITAAADDVTVDGLVITATPEVPVRTGIKTDDDYSGYLIRRNVPEDLDNYGIEIQASGRNQTVVESNCVRRNGGAHGKNVGDRAGIVAEEGTLREAVIRGNITADNFEGISVAGGYDHVDVVIAGNVVRRDFIGVGVARLSGRSLVTGNDIDLTGAREQYAGQTGDGFGVGLGGNVGLVVRGNRVTGAPGNGMSFGVVFNAGNEPSNTDMLVAGNSINANGSGGIRVYTTPAGTEPNLGNSIVSFNKTHNNGYGESYQQQGLRFSGITVNAGSSGNILHGNSANGNSNAGIQVAGTSNTLRANSMFDNGTVDARDLAPLGSNIWIGNRCRTSEPDLLCVSAG